MEYLSIEGTIGEESLKGPDKAHEGDEPSEEKGHFRRQRLGHANSAQKDKLIRVLVHIFTLLVQ